MSQREERIRLSSELAPSGVKANELNVRRTVEWSCLLLMNLRDELL